MGPPVPPRPGRFVHTLILAALTAALLPATLLAQPDTTRWTPRLSMQYDQITDTELAPNGEHVAYVVREALMDETTSTFRQHIYVAAADGTTDVQYTRGDHDNMSPEWSPEGSRIAFLSTRTEKPQVHVMRLRGGEAYPITDAETGVNSFHWGPEGERIAYTMTDPKSEAEKQREKEKRDVHEVNEEFRYSHLYTTEVKPAGDSTRTVQRLTGGNFHITGFDWSPDGSTIAFAHKPNPRVNSFTGLDISTVPADSGTVRPLVERPGVDESPRYSPDGETVAFLSAGGQKVWEDLSDVWTVPAEGGNPRALSETPNQHVTTLHGWTAGGDGLIVTDAAHTSVHLYEIPTGGESARQVSQEAGIHDAASYSRSADRFAFAYQNSATPQEVYVSPRAAFARRKVTSVNIEKPRPPMGRTERVQWTAPDGTRIEGLLTYPIDYERGDRVPVLLYIHGGPHSLHTRNFTGAGGFQIQFFARHGYAVLRPNPRGSTGYGREFRSEVVEKWGTADMPDHLSGLDSLVQAGVAHPDSLVVAGPSYGGFMTAFLVSQTDRFEAAGVYAGVINQISMLGTTDIPAWQAAQMGGEFPNRARQYEEHSPLYHVENVDTPTFVSFGAEDKRVPPSQGREFYRALKRQEVPTELLLYPRNAHSWGEPKQNIDKIRRTLDWFDQHLGR